MARRDQGSVRKLPSGRWQARYWDQFGQRHARTFATKADAGRHLASMRVDMERGAWRDPRLAKKTFANWTEEWWPTTAALRPSTRTRYDSLLRTHLLPTFQKRALGAITPLMVRGWHAQLVAASQEPGGLSPNTIAKAYRLLAKIMRDAVDSGLIVNSPCTIRGAAQDQPKEMKKPSPDDVVILLEHIPDRYRAFVLVAAWCGLRLGETAGLARRHIDLLHRTITVERQLTNVSGHLDFGRPKTDEGIRQVTMPKSVAEALEAHLDRWTAKTQDALVFTAPRGGPLRAEAFRSRVWNPAARAAGLSGLRIHDLRHLAGTEAAATPGATLRDVMARLGHRSPTAALRYQHASHERDQLIADHLDDLASEASRTREHGSPS
jgi:integrase